MISQNFEVERALVDLDNKRLVLGTKVYPWPKEIDITVYDRPSLSSIIWLFGKSPTVLVLFFLGETRFDPETDESIDIYYEVKCRGKFSIVKDGVKYKYNGY